MITLTVILALFSPRAAEVFTGVQREKPPTAHYEDAAGNTLTWSRNQAALAVPSLAAPVPTINWTTNRFAWNDSGDAMGYVLFQYSGAITNQYPTDQTNLTIVFNWPDHVERWFYHVIATNAFGDSDPSKRIHNPLYPSDRMDLFVVGRNTFTLEASIDRKTWSSQQVSNRATFLFTGSHRYFRAKAPFLSRVDYNPLNQ
jgi:hypothetical protein